MNVRSVCAVTLLLLSLAACGPLQFPGAPSTATPSITRTPAPTRPMPPTSTPDIPQPSATSPVPLTSSGPWLTYLSASKVGSEVVALNPDASGRTVIGAIPDVFVPLFARPSVCSPCWFSLQNGRDQSLTIFSLPAGAAQKSFTLLSNTELTAAQRQLYSTLLTQKNPFSQAWSPDGRFLAFIGAMDGAFTDLYVYDTQDDSLRRLTENTGEAYAPVWSPDGKWILVQEMNTSNHTGTITISTVYAFSPDGKSFRTLYHPASLGEQILGWTQPDTFIVASRRQYGLIEARRFNLEERRHSQLQYSGWMDQAVFSPERAALAFSALPKDKDVPSLVAGIYWTMASTGPVTVGKGKWQHMEWSSAARRFFASGLTGVLSFSPGEDKVTFQDEDNLPAASQDGQYLAFYSSESGVKTGLRIYSPDAKLVREVTNQPVQEALWRPDSPGLYYVASGSLYYLAKPTAEPRLLGEGVSNLGWVGAP